MGYLRNAGADTSRVPKRSAFRRNEILGGEKKEEVVSRRTWPQMCRILGKGQEERKLNESHVGYFLV